MKGGAPETPSRIVQDSPVIEEGSYKLERKRYFLESPGKIKLDLESAAVEEADVSESAPEPAGPTPQELAEQEAAAILAKARQEGEDLKRQAKEQGYTDGLKEGVERGRVQGREEAVGELRETLDRWLTMGDSLTEAWKARFEGLEQEIKDLAVAAAEKLVDRQLELSPEITLNVVREALRRTAEADQVTVLVAPQDLAMVRQAKEELGSMLKGTGRFEIAEDAKVSPGGCLVETKTQVIDASRKTRNENLGNSIKSRPS